MKLAIAALALLCLSIGANATSKTLGIKVGKTASGVQVDLPDITVPTLTMPEVNVAVQVKKPSLNMTTLDLPDFTIPTKELDLSGLAALLSKSGNSTASMAGLLSKHNVDLSALQAAINAALQKQASMTADAAAALQTLATAVYQAKYNVTSRIADMALEALSKPKPTVQLPEVDLSALTALLSKAKANITLPQFSMPTVDLSGLLALATMNKTMPAMDLAQLQELVNAITKGKLNVTMPEKNQVIDMAALHSSLAQLAASVEMPNIDINAIVDAIQSQKNSTAQDLIAIATLLAQQKKNVTADLVGMLQSMKQYKTVNFTIPTIQLPKFQKPQVDLSALVDTVQTLKNVTQAMAADNLKSAAILSWLNGAGFYQLGKNNTGKGGSVTINLGKQGMNVQHGN